MIKTLEKAGRTEDDAIKAALEELGLSRDDVSVEIIVRPKTGFLGIGAVQAVVRVSYDDQDTENNKPKTPVKEELDIRAEAFKNDPPVSKPSTSVKKEESVATPVSAEEENPVNAEIRSFLSGLFEKMDIEAEMAFSNRDNTSIDVSLSGNGMGAIIGRRGETLDAVQHLTNYVINRGRDKRLHINIDAEAYRSKREESLTHLAEKMAEKAMQSIDGVRYSINLLSEKASKVVASINEISGSVDTLTNMASLDNFDSKQANKAIDQIISTMYSSDNDEARQNINKKLRQLTGSESTTLYDLLENNYKHGTEEERKEAAQQLKIATLQAQHDANADVRRADLYKQVNSDRAKDNYLAYQKTLEGYDEKTGLSQSAMNKAKYNGEYHKGSYSMGVVGNALAGTGMGIMAGTGWSGIGAAVGGFLAAAGTILGTAGTGLLAKKETEAAIAKEQQKAFDEWNSKTVFEQKRQLQEERTALIKSIDSGKSDTKKQLKAIDQLLADISDKSSVIIRNLKEQNKEKAAEAILQTKYNFGNGKEEYLTNLNIQQLKNIGPAGIINAVAKQLLENGGMEGYFMYNDKDAAREGSSLTKYAENILKDVITDNETLQNIFNGGVYTLSETLQDAERFRDENGKLTDKYVEERLRNFATALGVTYDQLPSMEDSFGMLKLSELLQSTTQNVESIETYGNLLTEISDSSKSATKWMGEIVSQYPELIGYMSNTPKLMEKIMQKIKGLMQAQFESQWSELAKDSVFYTTLTKKSEEEVGYRTIKSEIDKIQNATLKEDVELLLRDTGAQNLQDLITELLKRGYNSAAGATEGVQTLGDIVQRIGEDYEIVSDAYQQQLQNYIEVNSKQLEMQLSNLEAQKQALQDINKQREYQNQLAEAQLKLENALNEKQRIYRAGVGFVYEADQAAIAKAQEELEDVERSKELSLLEQQTNLLQSIKDEWDNLYSKQTYELQKTQAEAFEKYILNDGADGLSGTMGTMSGTMSSVATAAAAMQGGVTTLEELTKQQMETQESNRNELVKIAAEKYQAYLNNPEDANAKDEFQEAYRNAISAGGSASQIMSSATAAQTEPIKEVINSLSTPTQGKTALGRFINKVASRIGDRISEGVDNYVTSGGLTDMVDVATSDQGEPDKATIKYYSLAYGHKYRTYAEGEGGDTSSQLAQPWSSAFEYYDKGIHSRAGDALSYAGYKSIKGQKGANGDSPSDWKFMVLVPNGNGDYTEMSLVKFYTGEVSDKNARKTWKDLKDKTMDEFYKELAAHVTEGSYVILSSVNNGKQTAVYLDREGKPMVLKKSDALNLPGIVGEDGKKRYPGDNVSIDITPEELKEYASGTLDNSKTPSLINEIGTEAIITDRKSVV